MNSVTHKLNQKVKGRWCLWLYKYKAFWINDQLSLLESLFVTLQRHGCQYCQYQTVNNGWKKHKTSEDMSLDFGVSKIVYVTSQLLKLLSWLMSEFQFFFLINQLCNILQENWFWSWQNPDEFWTILACKSPKGSGYIRHHK